MSNQRLTPNEAEAILLSEGSATDIGKAFGVSHQTVRLYKSLRLDAAKAAAARLADQGLKVVPLPNTLRKRFTDDEVLLIRQSKRSSAKEAETWGCSPATIRMIRTGKTYSK